MSNLHTHTDSALVALLYKGSEAAFTEIYNRYWKLLFAIAYKHAANKETAEEVVQDLFMRLWDKRKDVEIDNLGAYLATACKFSIFKLISREQHRQALLNTNHHPDTSIKSEDDINAKFLNEYIQGIVEQLPKQCKIIYKLNQEEDLSIKEIAAHLSISPNTARNQLAKARNVLRSTLKDANALMLFFF